jgi:anti-sigma factor RsiW
MKQCWPEGTLRAYLDGELPAEQMRSVAVHLEACPACARLHTELSVRASYVAGLMESLAIPAPLATPKKAVVRSSGSWLWTGAAVAVAAGLAIAFLLIPKQEPAGVVQSTPPVKAVLVPQQTADLPVVSPAPREAATTVATRTPRPRRVKPADPFIALDDEPIENGIVMRVELPGSTPADIVFSPDGRARAVRLVSGTQRNY